LSRCPKNGNNTKKTETVTVAPTAPTPATRRSERISRQDSDLTRVTKSLRINSGSESDSRSSYELKDLPPLASKYSEDDMEALNVTFEPASNENEVIPNIQGRKYAMLINHLMDILIILILSSSDKHPSRMFSHRSF
jgi:hypothetical protein